MHHCVENAIQYFTDCCACLFCIYLRRLENTERVEVLNVPKLKLKEMHFLD